MHQTVTAHDIRAGRICLFRRLPFQPLNPKTGQPMLPLTPGEPRQREFAFRSGVNIVMYTLTGNYKTDLVHAPALIERLGQ